MAKTGRTRTQPEFCITCGNPNYPELKPGSKHRHMPVRGECHRCYQYRFSTGKAWAPPELRKIEAPCRICGERTSAKRNRCERCYRYWYVTGREHSEAKPQAPVILNVDGRCSNCRRESDRIRQGRCMACYEYRRTRGIERSLDGSHGKSVRICIGCQRPKAIRGYGKCATCLEHQKRQQEREMSS